MCAFWTDHVWSEPRFVEAGRHPTRGRFQRFVTRCEHCDKTSTETRWLDLYTKPVSEQERRDD